MTEGQYVSPRLATSVCDRCQAEVRNVDLEDHVRGHQRRPPVASLVPTTKELPGGIVAFSTGVADYQRRPNGTLVRRTRDGTFIMYSPCPRCHHLVDVARAEDHMGQHVCSLQNCGILGRHTHCILPSCDLMGTRHAIDHAVGVLGLPDFTPRRMDELVRLSAMRPHLVLEAIIDAAAKQNRTLRAAESTSTCPACMMPIEPGTLIESVLVPGETTWTWIHARCPSSFPLHTYIGPTTLRATSEGTGGSPATAIDQPGQPAEE